jgi:uncharacterized membrane protein YebE (DUF533 family)
MNAERLIGSLIRGAIGSKGKRAKGALRFLTGGRNSFLNASTLLTVAGVAWGLMESATGGAAPSSSGSSPALPPLPNVSSGDPALPPIPDHLHRLLRLTISAAHADGRLSPAEQDQIRTHARDSGAEIWVEKEITSPTPLAEIVSGVTDRQVKEDLYELAFSIVHADEGVSGGERVYLAQLAHLLSLETHTVARIEKHAIDRIVQSDSPS